MVLAQVICCPASVLLAGSPVHFLEWSLNTYILAPEPRLGRKTPAIVGARLECVRGVR